MPQAEIASREHGRLANNHMAVLSLQSILSRTEGSMTTLPKVMARVIREGAWQHWVCDEGEFRWNAADFRKFLEAKRPAGCETPIAIVRRALQGTDAEEPFEELIRGERGGTNNPFGRAGKPEEEINRDSITVDSEPPATIPIPAARDYTREAPTGTSVSYAIRRISRNRPDLYERVRAGELSPHGAMVEAGFSPRKITIPLDPAAAVRLITKHFKGDDLDRLIQGLVDWAGVPESNNPT